MTTMWGRSLYDRMSETGRSSGFDYLRVLLACAVIVWHSFGVTRGMPFAFRVENSPLRPLIMAVLPMFFGLSGFLVAGSLGRNRSVSTFLGLRAIRIFPALAVESLLSAWLIGAAITAFPLGKYFRSATFWQYHLNIIGDIHYYLPGVFQYNPIKMVNAQLATVPWELQCYIALIALAVVGLVKRPRLFLGLVAATTVFEFVWNQPSIEFAHSNVGSTILVFTFLAAVGIYGLKDVVPWSSGLAALSALALAVLFQFPGGDYLCPLPAAYLTIYLGLLNPKKIWLFKGADYSYGMYLYGFVIQQTIQDKLPWARHWWINMPLSLFGAAVFAAFSWYVIEKNAMELRRYLPSLEHTLSQVRLPSRVLR